jgi:hypothetical protein
MKRLVEPLMTLMLNLPSLTFSLLHLGSRSRFWSPRSTWPWMASVSLPSVVLGAAYRVLEIGLLGQV